MQVTVLMPFNNNATHFEESFRSVLAQSYPNVQILIGVHGHAPNSREHNLAQAMARRFKNVTVAHYEIPSATPNKKAYVLNRMVEGVHTNVVAILDGDSVWLPDKLAVQTAAMQSGNYDVVGTLTRYISDDVFRDMVPKLSTESLHAHNFLLANPIIHSSALLRTEHAYWNTSCISVEDYDLWLRLWRRERKFFNVPAVLTLTRNSGDPVPRNINDLFAKIKEAKRPSPVTVVTAYYRVNGKRSADFYLDRIRHFLTSIPCHLVVVTTADMAPFMHECRREFQDRTVVEVREFDELHAARNMQFWNDQFKIDPERKTHNDSRLYAIWAEKPHFVQLAIGLNPFLSDYFVWCDIGSFRNETVTPRLQSFPSPKRVKSLDNTKMYISQLGHPKERLNEFISLKTTRPVTVAGGFICGHKALWKDYAARIDNMFEAVAATGSFAGKEQDIMYADALLHPRLYNLVQPKPYFGNEWFYMQYFLSDEYIK